MIIYEVIFLTLLAALVSSFAQLMFKKSVKKIDSIAHIIGLLKNRGVLLGLLGYGVGFLLYLPGLAAGQLSVVYPIFASTFIFVTLLSATILKEKIAVLRWVGVLLVFAGITIVAIS